MVTTKNDLCTHKGNRGTGKGLFAPQATEGEDTAREPQEPWRALAWVPPFSASLLVSASSPPVDAPPASSPSSLSILGMPGTFPSQPLQRLFPLPGTPFPHPTSHPGSWLPSSHPSWRSWEATDHPHPKKTPSARDTPVPTHPGPGHVTMAPHPLGWWLPTGKDCGHLVTAVSPQGALSSRHFINIWWIKKRHEC